MNIQGQTGPELPRSRWRDAWSLAEGLTYLNHGSFGPPPDVVRRSRLQWIDALDAQPMDVFVFRYEAALQATIDRLAEWLGTRADNLVLIDNATTGMNVVAGSFPLSAGDEVLLTDHEYGAVQRIWQRACERRDAKLVTAQLPFPPGSKEELIEAILQRVTEQTRIVVVSHITSNTALVLPVAALCARLRERDVAICIDGPHAPAQLTLRLDDLDCDFYTGSLHKWVCAPFGTGMLYVDPRWQASIQPLVLSWGRLQPAVPERWTDEFLWSGTRDLSAYLAVPAALDFLDEVGLDTFRAYSAELAIRGRELIDEVTGYPPVVDATQWHRAMTLAEVSPCDALELRDALRQQFGISVPVIAWGERRFVRISCHLYNDEVDLQKLATAIGHLTQ